MFVPYGDPGPMHYRKLVLDEGEYGIGLLTNSLELGCDCLGEIAYLDGVVNDNDGNAVVLRNAVCLHEEDHGIAWKHTDFRTGYVEVRRMRRMVVSSIVTVGNYEYAYYWYLYQDGTIEYEVKLSGVISNGVVAPGEAPEYGTLVAPGIYGPHHQHFFNVRLDMAVDGAANRVYEVTPTADPEGPGNPVGNAWRAREVLITDETMARREADPLAGRYWKVVNDGVKNELGQPVAYKLVPSHVIRPFAHPGSAVARRAPFMFSPLWVTAYDRDEMFATGDYPNQAAGGAGLPAFAARQRNLTDTDLVLWFTFGTNHVVRPEDWPVMPVHPIGFRLLPVGFFTGNPSLDNPPPGAARTAITADHLPDRNDSNNEEEREHGHPPDRVQVRIRHYAAEPGPFLPRGTRSVGGQHGPKRGNGAAPTARLLLGGQRHLAVLRAERPRHAGCRVLCLAVRDPHQQRRLVLRLGGQGARSRRGQRRGLGARARLPVHRHRLRDRLRDLRGQPAVRLRRHLAGQPLPP